MHEYVEAISLEYAFIGDSFIQSLSNVCLSFIGADYSANPSLPQIAHFPVSSSGGDAPDPNLWCTRIQTVNDSVTEGPESLILSILSTQVGVLVAQQSTVVTILDDEGEQHACHCALPTGL